MREGRNGFGFALEAGEAGLVLGELRRQDFDRDIAIEARVRGAIDFAHAARTQRRTDLVLTKFGARGKHGPRRA
jgi:hypothetical protein